MVEYEFINSWYKEEKEMEQLKGNSNLYKFAECQWGKHQVEKWTISGEIYNKATCHLCFFNLKTSNFSLSDYSTKERAWREK